MNDRDFELLEERLSYTGNNPVKMWTRGVPVEEAAMKQLYNVSMMPFIHKHVAVMPDCHWGNGACVGSVIPTTTAIIPAAVGTDLGCGMMAVQTSLTSHDLPENLKPLRSLIEKRIPHGRDNDGGHRDKGGWGSPPTIVQNKWKALDQKFREICDRHPKIEKSNNIKHLGTLGTGNHFIEVCLDEGDYVWVMLHSGSRGVGNRIGSYFIEKAKKEMEQCGVRLLDVNLSYLSEGSENFNDYVQAVGWAQEFARMNREIMMGRTLDALRETLSGKPFKMNLQVVNCHHNYISREVHFGSDVWVTRKGAVRAGLGEMGIIPGSMGAKSFIVRGKGNDDSFHSCSHGAGRVMSRTKAKKLFTLDDHIKATEGVECRKDEDVIDETPKAYKDIDAVMTAQSDLIEVVHTLRQVLCVKG